MGQAKLGSSAQMMRVTARHNRPIAHQAYIAEANDASGASATASSPRNPPGQSRHRTQTGNYGSQTRNQATRVLASTAHPLRPTPFPAQLKKTPVTKSPGDIKGEAAHRPPNPTPPVTRKLRRPRQKHTAELTPRAEACLQYEGQAEYSKPSGNLSTRHARAP